MRLKLKLFKSTEIGPLVPYPSAPVLYEVTDLKWSLYDKIIATIPTDYIINDYIIAINEHTHLPLERILYDYNSNKELNQLTNLIYLLVVIDSYIRLNGYNATFMPYLFILED